MGMFDEIIIHNNFLPDEFHDEIIKWQTKDLDAALVENGFLKTLIRCQDEKI